MGRVTGRVNKEVSLKCFFLMAGFFQLVFLASCLRLSPGLLPPEEIHFLDGQASFNLKTPEHSGRLRLAFYFWLPEKGRLEVFNPLGKLESLVWFNGPRAVLYFPGEKIFWEGPVETILSDFFGEKLEVEELALLLAARWSRLKRDYGWGISQEGNNLPSGFREGLSFKVMERLSGSPLPKVINFESQEFVVRVKLLKLRFNCPQKDSFFSPSVPSSAQKLSWEDISSLWKR